MHFRIFEKKENKYETNIKFVDSKMAFLGTCDTCILNDLFANIII